MVGYCKNKMEHTNETCEQNVEYLMLNLTVHTVTTTL
jgi:hypothetical protein